ncbi:unnamed protein product (macronuclear) [Paramecium tetraurelia]|uniref:RING-type domain-containing protein n=1 Tax=Paramecium tetraurelia TaxID=5888 RepID=A0CI95_PARTE|nr:uncharacterized protein GSPATT00007647001 [Paramecium tetraurelia]CAK70512.1 unnamed protein product [Paramecium tetraurelia]|eukprot:XP_001437909.1 hypothetical protein (macronuclear) [Paramecium tetraurelia strain d4-2]
MPIIDCFIITTKVIKQYVIAIRPILIAASGHMKKQILNLQSIMKAIKNKRHQGDHHSLSTMIQFLLKYQFKLKLSLDVCLLWKKEEGSETCFIRESSLVKFNLLGWTILRQESQNNYRIQQNKCIQIEFNCIQFCDTLQGNCKYYCPICFKYYDCMLHTTCCSNYVCHVCAVQSLANKMYNCHYCRNDHCKYVDVDPAHQLKIYIDSHTKL